VECLERDFDLRLLDFLDLEVLDFLDLELLDFREMELEVENLE
jgi:hypothetical protein